MLSKKIIKYIQSLSHKKERDEQNSFLAEGPKIITEFLGSENFKCKILCAEKEWLSENENLLKKILPDNIFEVDKIQLQKVSFLKTPNKVSAVFEKKDQREIPEVHNKLSLILDDIQDPGNMGAIIRIADWFAIENIICGPNCTDCYNPKVVQAAMGSLGHVNVLYVLSLQDFIEKNADIKTYAADLEGAKIQELGAITEGMILIGNESRGISEELLKIVAQKITIPKYGNAESLNAAVAAGIILSHLRNPKAA